MRHVVEEVAKSVAELLKHRVDVATYLDPALHWMVRGLDSNMSVRRVIANLATFLHGASDDLAAILISLRESDVVVGAAPSTAPSTAPGSAATSVDGEVDSEAPAGPLCSVVFQVQALNANGRPAQLTRVAHNLHALIATWLEGAESRDSPMGTGTRVRARTL